MHSPRISKRFRRRYKKRLSNVWPNVLGNVRQIQEQDPFRNKNRSQEHRRAPRAAENEDARLSQIRAVAIETVRTHGSSDFDNLVDSVQYLCRPLRPEVTRAEAVDARRIAAPTLLVTGDADTINPVSVARDLANRIRGSRLVTADRGGHWLTIEKPAESNRWIAEFVK